MENWFKLEFIFTKNLHIHPLILDQMEFYRVEYMLMNYEEFVEEENKQTRKQQKEQDSQMKLNQPKFETPKMPNMNMNMPSF